MAFTTTPTIYPDAVVSGELKTFVEARLLAFNDDIKDRYRRAISAFIHNLHELNTHQEAFYSALKEFNQLLATSEFEPTEVRSLRSELSGEIVAAGPGFPKLGAELIAEIQAHLATETSILKKNILKLVIQVLVIMDEMRLVNKLTYHQIWHALEMLNDVTQCVHQEGLYQFKLIAALAALFHDIFFKNNNRLIDECDSRDALIRSLEPLLSKLSATSRGFIERQIDILIVGGTTPAFARPTDGSIPPSDHINHFSSSSVWAFGVEFLLLRGYSFNDMETQQLILTRVMSDCDINSTSIPELIDSERSPALTACQTNLKGIILDGTRLPESGLAQELLKLGQSTRVLLETAQDIPSIRSFFEHKQEKPFLDLHLNCTDDDLTAFRTKIVKGPFSEIAFSGVMTRSVSTEPMDRPWYQRKYKFVPTWRTHTLAFEAISTYFSSSDISFKDKTATLEHFLFICTLQRGKSIGLAQILEIINLASTVARIPSGTALAFHQPNVTAKSGSLPDETVPAAQTTTPTLPIILYGRDSVVTAHLNLTPVKESGSRCCCIQ